jgi:ferric-dicitrate binding protein FerR (iron transport regulator)
VEDARPPTAQGGSLGFFSAVDGTVEFARGGTGRWFRAREGAGLVGGDRLRTRFSRARVELESGSVVCLNRFTTLTLGEGAGPPGLEIVGGEVYVETVPADRGFRVETPHGRVVDLGTRFVVDVAVHSTTVVCAEGKVEASTDGGRASLARGELVRLARR